MPIQSDFFTALSSSTVNFNPRGDVPSNGYGAPLTFVQTNYTSTDYSVQQIYAGTTGIKSSGNNALGISVMLGVNVGSNTWPQTTVNTVAGLATLEIGAPAAMPLIFAANSFSSSTSAKSLSFSQSVKTATALIGGFSVSYSDSKAHYIKTLDVSLGSLTPTSSGVTFTPACTISDDSGNSGSGGIYVIGVGVPNNWQGGSLIAPASAVFNPGASATTATFSFSDLRQPLQGAVIGMTGFQLGFSDGNDHKVQNLRIDCGNNNVIVTNTQTDGTWSATVTCTPGLGINDSSGNGANSSSQLNLYAIGLI